MTLAKAIELCPDPEEVIHGFDIEKNKQKTEKTDKIEHVHTHKHNTVYLYIILKWYVKHFYHATDLQYNMSLLTFDMMLWYR